MRTRGRASTRWCWLCMCVFFHAHHRDYKFSCAAKLGSLQMSSELLSVCPLCLMALLQEVWPCDWAPALAVDLTLFFKMTSEGGTFHQMHHGLIKCCSLPRLMGLRTDYAGLYIMSVRQWSTLLCSYMSTGKKQKMPLLPSGSTPVVSLWCGWADCRLSLNAVHVW